MTAQRAERPAVFGTGLIALDMVMSANSSQPVRSWTGGTCGNVLSILSYLGWDAYPIARLNGDAASLRVKADLQRWGVHLDYAACAPTCATPIIIQEIRKGKNGVPKHRFSWSCPRCGSWLPGFKPVTARCIEPIVEGMKAPHVFFMDRLSRSSLSLAAAAAKRGAVVVFEPSSKSDQRFFEEALRLAHIVKYADQRLAEFDQLGGIGQFRSLGDPDPRFGGASVSKLATEGSRSHMGAFAGARGAGARRHVRFQQRCDTPDCSRRLPSKEALDYSASASPYSAMHFGMDRLWHRGIADLKARAEVCIR